MPMPPIQRGSSNGMMSLPLNEWIKGALSRSESARRSSAAPWLPLPHMMTTLAAASIWRAIMVMSCACRELGIRPQRRNARDAVIGFGFHHIEWKRQMCNAAARVGSRDRLMNECRRLRCGGNSFGIERDIAEQQIRLGRLEKVDAAHLAHHVAGKSKDRRMVAGCFIKSSDKVRAARTGRACADAQAAGQLRLSRSGECRSLLM